MSKYTDSHSQPKPVDNGGPNIHELVQDDILSRAEFGHNKYGKYLTPNDTRDNLKDAYQEAIDLVFYLRKEIYERDNR
jgi:hypothetical protein